MTRIVDLSAVIPEALEIQLEKDGPVWELPGDLPVPDYLELSRLLERVSDPDGKDAEGAFIALNEKVRDLFLERNDDAPPLGPRGLGALVIELYSGLGEGEEPERPPKPAKRAGTTNGSRRKRATRSRS